MQNIFQVNIIDTKTTSTFAETTHHLKPMFHFDTPCFSGGIEMIVSREMGWDLYL